MLIRNGADINHKGAYERTALIIVAGQGKEKKCPFPSILLLNICMILCGFIHNGFRNTTVIGFSDGNCGD